MVILVSSASGRLNLGATRDMRIARCRVLLLNGSAALGKNASTCCATAAARRNMLRTLMTSRARQERQLQVTALDFKSQQHVCMMLLAAICAAALLQS
eukprot:19115-Heterococcus_DN1.PRE.1